MALTITPIYKWALQPSEFMSVIKVVGDTSYPNPGANGGGYAITPAMFTLTTFASTSDAGLQAPPTPGYFVMSDLVPGGTAGGLYGELDTTTGLLRIYTAGGVELANTVTAVGYAAYLIAFGH